MSIEFDDAAFADFTDWLSKDRKKALKICDLAEDILRNGAMLGTGKPERLKYRSAYSRRIDKENRLIYTIDENGNVHIISCKGHYEE